MNSKKEFIAVLDNIRSIHNVGSIFRTADGAGIAKLYLCGITPTPFDRLKNLRPQFAKVALGAEEFMPWEYRASGARLIAQLQEEGYAILALEQHARAIPYTALTKTKLPQKIALVVGNEPKGISRSILHRADHIIELPMHGHKESLNVSVAFGIAAYYLTNEIS